MIVEFENGLLSPVDQTQFVATTEAEGRHLLDVEKIPRGRVWSPREIRLVRELGATRDEVQTIVTLKLDLDCRVDEVFLDAYRVHEGPR